MMEVFHVLMHHGFKPRRTLHFVAFAAEEGGLLGSTDLAQNYYVRGGGGGGGGGSGGWVGGWGWGGGDDAVTFLHATLFRTW
jgi:hypothetical protein